MELEGLSFQITSSAEKVSGSIDMLIGSLKKLERITSARFDSLEKLNSALAKFDTKKVGKLVGALKALDSVKDVTISPTLASRIANLADSVKKITDDDVETLKDLTDSLKDLGEVGDIHIPNIKRKKNSKREAVEHTAIPVSENTKKQVTELTLVMQSLATVTDRAIVPLNQLAAVGVSVFESLEEIIEGVWKYVNAAGELGGRTAQIVTSFGAFRNVIRELGSGVSQAIVPFQQFHEISTQFWHDFEEIINGTWRYIDVAGLLGSGNDQAIDSFRQLGFVLEETKPKYDDMIEGTWRYVESVEDIGKSLSEASAKMNDFANQAKESFEKSTEGARSFGETIKNVLRNMASVCGEVGKEFIEWISNISTAVSNVIAPLMPFIAILKVLQNILLGIIDVIKRVIRTFWNLLAPVREVVKEIGGKLLSAVSGVMKSGFKKLGDVLLSPFTRVKKAIASVKHAFGNLINSIGRVAVYRAIRSVIKEISQGFKEGIDNLYQYSRLINGDFAKSMDSLTTNMLYLKNSLGAMVSPIINALAPAFDILTEKIVGVINAVNMLIARLTGRDTYTAAKKLVKAYNEIKNATIGIDELNIIGDDVDDYASMFEELPITDDIKNFADKLREAFEKGDWEELGRTLGEKFNEIVDNMDWEGIGEKIGYYINGAIETAYYFLDEVDFAGLGGHLAEMINNIIEEIDWEIVGRLFVKKITVLWDLVIGFLEELDWGLVAASLSDFVVGVFSEFVDWFKSWDWIELAETFMNKIQDFFDNLDMVEIGKKAGEFFKTLFGSFKEWLENVDWVEIGKDLLDAILDFFGTFDFETVISEFFSFLGTAAKSVKDLLSPLWDGIVQWWDENIKGDTFTETLENLVNYLIEFVDKNVLTPFMKALFGDGMEEEQSGLDKLKEIGKNIIQGILKGAEDYIKDNLWKWIANFFFGSWWDMLCKAFGIHSPAETMIPIGENIMLGILEGMVNIIKNIGSWLRKYILQPFIGAFTALFTGGSFDVPLQLEQISTKFVWDEDAEELKKEEKVQQEELWKSFESVGILESITQIGNDIMNALEEGVKELIKSFESFEFVLLRIKTYLNEILNLLIGIAKSWAINLLVNDITPILANIADRLASLANQVITVTITAVETVSGVVAVAKAKVAEFAGTVATATLTAVETVSGVVAAAKAKVAEFAGQVATATLTAVETVSGVVAAAKAKVAEFAGQVATATLTAVETVSGVVAAAKAKVAEFAGTVATATLTAVETVSDAVGTAKAKLHEVASTIYEAVINAKDNVDNAVSNAKSKLHEVANGIYQAVINAKDNVNSAVSSAKSKLNEVAATKSEAVITAEDDASQTISFIDALLGDLSKGEVVAVIDAEDNASSAIGNIKAALDSLPTSKLITITVSVVGAALGLGALGFAFGKGGIVPHATGGIVPHATGSIINRPTLANYKGTTHLFGEAGREAILPLDSYTGWMDEVAERVENRLNDDSYEAGLTLPDLINFYMGYMQPVMANMDVNMQRQADKDERPVVKIGNRDIRNAYNSQTKADGYKFTR